LTQRQDIDITNLVLNVCMYIICVYVSVYVFGYIYVLSV